MSENEYVDGILDNDLYKFTMQNAICFNYPKEVVRYTFINRDNREFPDGFAVELKRILQTFRGFKLSKNEKYYLLRLYYLNPVYVDFLNSYQFDPNEVSIRQSGSKLECFVEGYW